jgi:hypothetical protein
VLFAQFDWSLMQLQILLHYSHQDKNEMASRFVNRSQTTNFLLNEAAVTPNTRKPQRILFNTVYRRIL